MYDVRIDRTKCLTPMVCKKCIQVCPQKVFFLGAKIVERYKETDATLPGSYILSAMYRDQCLGCNRCIDVCPIDAVNVFPYVPKEKAEKA